ncbi:MAG: hypothetical protein IKL59_06250, partial [Clostridia bacterium]|nr:hypothetical protein [Clostridia bacterium]
AVRSPNSSENARIYQMVEEDMASDECDEWYIVKKVISVKNYYDNTFAQDSTLVSYIDDAVSFANKVYSANFGIGVYMDGVAIYDPNAIASQCNDECNCASQSHSNHCRGLGQMSEYLYDRAQGREADHIYVMWANRPPVYDIYTYNYYGQYCRIHPKTKIHEYTSALGAVTDFRPVINILYVYRGLLPYNTTLACMSITLAHEMVHCLGMDDVYDLHFAAHEANKYSCIMDNPILNNPRHDHEMIDLYDSCLNNNNPFCDDCKLIFSEHVSDYTSGDRPISES